MRARCAMAPRKGVENLVLVDLPDIMTRLLVAFSHFERYSVLDHLLSIRGGDENGEKMLTIGYREGGLLHHHGRLPSRREKFEVTSHFQNFEFFVRSVCPRPCSLVVPCSATQA